MLAVPKFGYQRWLDDCQAGGRAYTLSGLERPVTYAL